MNQPSKPIKMNPKFKLGLSLFLLGMVGVLSMLTVEIPMDSLPKEVMEKLSPQMLKLLVIVNPALLMLVFVFIGTFLHDKVGLTVPTVSSLLKISTPQISFLDQLKSGVLLGSLTGILLVLFGIIFKSFIPQEFIDIAGKIKITTIARFAYGGITEELLMRYGFMTLMVWIVFKISKKLNPTTYWLGIAIAALLFAVGHFPVVYSAVPEPSIMLLMYVLIGNSIAGFFFGWLYWKKGLEAAMIGHIFAHVFMIIGESVFSL